MLSALVVIVLAVLLSCAQDTKGDEVQVKPDATYNEGVYGGYIDQIVRAVTDEEYFKVFKNSDKADEIWAILFYYYNIELGDKSVADDLSVPPDSVGFRALGCVSTHGPDLLEGLPHLVAEDLKVGEPTLNLFAVKRKSDEGERRGIPKEEYEKANGCLWKRRNRIPLEEEEKALLSTYDIVASSANVYKYLYELMELRKNFGDPREIFKGWNILEVGGGYGGFATTVGHFYGDHIGDYNVVDLAPVCKLQRKYLDAIESVVAEKFRCIPSTETGAIEGKEIDLFISFFSISEQKKEIVDLYLKEYASKSKRGYLQLNYDEERYWGLDDGRYNILEIFKEIYKIHPDAVLLGPGTCGVYNHHRIKWGMK